jgi:hypothetical protein
VQPIVNADGVPLRGWVWKDLPLDAIRSVWVPKPFDAKTGTSLIEWRGRSTWAVMEFHSSKFVQVTRNRMPVVNPGTTRHGFPDVRAARRYCEYEDQR